MAQTFKDKALYRSRYRAKQREAILKPLSEELNKKLTEAKALSVRVNNLLKKSKS